MKRRSPFTLFTLGMLFLLVVFYLFIIFSGITYTSLDVFLDRLFSQDVLRAISVSLLTATISTLFALFIAVPVAYALSKAQFRGKQALDAILDLPVVLPPIALGTALLIYFNTNFGLPIRDLFVFQPLGIVLAQFVVISALMIRLMKSVFDGIDQRYEMVARTMGYTQSQAFLKVSIPMAKTGILSAVILGWARAVGEFGATITLVGASKSVRTLPVAIYDATILSDIPGMLATIYILVIISLIVLLTIRWLGGRSA
jgi:molybdate transport system permease protein